LVDKQKAVMTPKEKKALRKSGRESMNIPGEYGAH
jgi:hypothetical protein